MKMPYSIIEEEFVKGLPLEQRIDALRNKFDYITGKYLRNPIEKSVMLCSWYGMDGTLFGYEEQKDDTGLSCIYDYRPTWPYYNRPDSTWMVGLIHYPFLIL